MSSGLTIISSPASTQLDDDASARQCIEAAIARRKDEFALSHVFWTADYGYIVKFHLGAVEVVRTAVEMLVFEEPWRMTRMLDGVRLTFNALALDSQHPKEGFPAGQDFRVFAPRQGEPS